MTPMGRGRGGGKGVIEEGFGGKTAELLAGGGELLVAAGR